MAQRNTFGEIQVGDGIKTYVDLRDGPSNAYANGRLWDGEVTAVEPIPGNRVRLTVNVHGRSLCADDLVYGFGCDRDGGFKPVTYILCHGADEYVQRRVRDARSGRRYWSGYEVHARVEVPVGS